MVARKTLILLINLFLTVSAGVAYGQTSYVNSQEGIFQLTGGPGSCDRVLLTNGCSIDHNLLSIAVYKDTIYYNTWAGELKRFKIGVPGSCELLIDGGPTYNAMTVDKNGVVYMASQELVRYDPYTNQLTNLGTMPFYSAGDMMFFKDKLLLAGYDPYDWSTGIYEININDLAASNLYMSTPPFIGLLSYPVACGNNRYFGLSSVNSGGTWLTELDLVHKTITGNACSMPADILDAASSTETGVDDRVAITAIMKTNPDNCVNNNGSIAISASSLHTPVSYTLLNSGLRQTSGNFTNLRGGIYNFRIADAGGCIKDTSIAIGENIPAGRCNDIFIPDAFTPNNDGRNDFFNPSFPATIKNISLQVFNRLGSKVYEGMGNTISWDGSYKGTKQPSAVFVYILSYTDQNGDRKTRKGALVLIR
jgi:gliding motility-associated-like protein